MQLEKFKGLWPAIFTPVNKDGSLNVKELEKLIEMLISQQVDGLYLLGSTGQGFLFTEQERERITEVALEINAKRLPIMVQVGALNTSESIKLAKHASINGADAISSVGPIYYSASTNMAFEHYQKIAGATDLPFFPYQIGKSASSELIDKLMSIKNIGGMKLTTVKLLEISSIQNKVSGTEWKLFSGADELLCHAALCGTAGAIGTTYNLLGKTCKHIRQEFLDGNVKIAIGFMLEFQKLIEEIMPFIWTFFRRAMVLKYNIDIGDPKPPLLSSPLPWSDDMIMRRIGQLEVMATMKTENSMAF
jgi:N-acetylneuraminate lyase